MRVVQIGHHRLNPRASKQTINQLDETDTLNLPKILRKMVAGDGLEDTELLREVREADGVAEHELGPPAMKMTGRFSL
jgi:hypothetical protein